MLVTPPRRRPRALSRSSPQVDNIDPSGTNNLPTIPDITPRHYLGDPATQRQLKLFFGTDEKFDEVLEYGFPVENGLEVQVEAPKPTRPQPNLRTRTAIADYQKALKSDSLSFLDEDEDDEDDDVDHDHQLETEIEHPNTAEPEHELYHERPSADSHLSSRSSVSSIDLDSPATPRLSTQEESFVATLSDHTDDLTSMPSISSLSESKLFSPSFLFGCDRNATLRITLTRPDISKSTKTPVTQPDEKKNLTRPGMSTKAEKIVSHYGYDAQQTATFDMEAAFEDEEQDARDVEQRLAVDLMRPNMDLLALEPLQFLPDHTAITTLTSKSRRKGIDATIQGMLTRMRTPVAAPKMPAMSALSCM